MDPIIVHLLKLTKSNYSHIPHYLKYGKLWACKFCFHGAWQIIIFPDTNIVDLVNFYAMGHLLYNLFIVVVPSVIKLFFFRIGQIFVCVCLVGNLQTIISWEKLLVANDFWSQLTSFDDSYLSETQKEFKTGFQFWKWVSSHHKLTIMSRCREMKYFAKNS